MEYKVKFRIKLEGREVVDTIVVDAKNEKEAFKKVKENTLSRPKIISIKEMQPVKRDVVKDEIDKLNSVSKVQLTKQETRIAQEVFADAFKSIIKHTDKLHKDMSDTAGFSRNKIILRLAEMFDREVETNY